jgi:hypothetical protein
MVQLYVIMPVGADGSVDNTLPGGRPGHVAPPIYHPGHPDHGLPSVPGHPGNRPPGSWGGPTDPGFGSGGGEYPSHGLPGSPGHPGNWVPGSGQYPTGGPVIPPISAPPHPWVPPEGSEIPDPPAEIAANVVIAIWDPATQTWAVASAPPAQPK